MTLAVTLAVTFHTSKSTQQNQNKPLISDTDSDMYNDNFNNIFQSNDPERDPYQTWLETGVYPDGIKLVHFDLQLKEVNGKLDDTVSWMLHGSTELTPINGKRIRMAADAAFRAFLETLEEQEQ